MPDVRVVQVPKGSVIVLTGVDVAYNEDGADTSILGDVKTHIAASIGHDQFAVLALSDDGDALVHNVEEVRDLVTKATTWTT